MSPGESSAIEPCDGVPEDTVQIVVWFCTLELPAHSGTNDAPRLMSCSSASAETVTMVMTVTDRLQDFLR